MRVDDRGQHLRVDTGGLLRTVLVTAAGVQDDEVAS
jgi:hypothetical protein